MGVAGDDIPHGQRIISDWDIICTNKIIFQIRMEGKYFCEIKSRLLI